MSKNKVTFSLPLCIVSVLAVMVIFEIVKTDLLTFKRQWISQLLTIAFVTTVSAGAYMRFKKYSQFLFKLIEKEKIEKAHAMGLMDQENYNLKTELNVVQHDLNTVQAEFSRQMSKYQELIHTLPEYIIHTDFKGKILQANHEVLNGTGLAYEELFGKDIRTIIWEDERQRFLEGFQKTLEGATVKELVVRDLKGKQFLFNFILLKKLHEETVGVLCVAMELSKTSKIIDELNKSRQELKQTIKEMELLHRVSIEREKRILELKQQIEGLKQELAKYRKVN